MTGIRADWLIHGDSHANGSCLLDGEAGLSEEQKRDDGEQHDCSHHLQIAKPIKMGFRSDANISRVCQTGELYGRAQSWESFCLSRF